MKPILNSFGGIWAVLAGLVLYAGPVSRLEAAERKANVSLEHGLKLFHAGASEQAVAVLTQVAEQCAAKSDRAGQVSAMLTLSAAQQTLGQYCSATVILERGLLLAQAEKSLKLEMQVRAALGNIHLFTRRFASGEDQLRQALALARQIDDRFALAATLQSLANVLLAQEAQPRREYQRNARGLFEALPEEAPKQTPYEEGMQCYAESKELARRLGDTPLLTKILLNQARALMLHGDYPMARTTADEAAQRLSSQPDTREKGFELVSCGRLYAELSASMGNTAVGLRLKALTAYQEALRLAEPANDLRTETYAHGYSGELYLREGRWKEAMALTQRAAFLAQKSGNDEARFLWEWQAARLLRDQGQLEEAITAYRQAVMTLNSQRSDFFATLAMRGGRVSFRDSLGQAYYELADLLLRRADLSASRADLVEARNTVEMLKAVEIEDYYFEDECVNLLRTKAKSVEVMVQHAAVIYTIPLADRTELLLTLPSGLKRVTSPFRLAEVVAEARQLREKLENPVSEGHLAHAQRLWTWLILPIEATLQAEKVDTLVFVPDGALRTIPMAALHDGTRYLIEKYAVSVSPGLSLMDPRQMPREQMNILLCGLSKAQPGFQALGQVPIELKNIHATMGGKQLLDEHFQLTTFEREMTDSRLSVVHLASHGEFGGDASKTFILAYDGKLTMDRLEQLILPHMLSDQPIELLTLSACRTAAGDERAALGLAGLAVKSGARSALATLWYVNDEASQRVMSGFYANLKQDRGLSKARALQRAQCALLADEQFRHPCFWSPFLMIGNWL